MTQFTEEQLQSAYNRAREDLMTFCLIMDKNYKPSWHHDEIAEKLTKVANGEIKRLMLFMPPRHGKSQLASIYFPAWYLGKFPDKEVVTASYGAELAQDFGYKTRNALDSSIYGQIFETRLKADSKSKAKWLTNKGGSYTSVGVGGALTGRGADVLILDDLIKGYEESMSDTIRDNVWNWYTTVAHTRLQPSSPVILIMTRWHQDDIAGRLEEQAKEGGEQWEIIKYPAIATGDEKKRKEGDPLWPSRFNKEWCDQEKIVQGPIKGACLYQQNPILSDYQIFKRDYFRYHRAEIITATDGRKMLVLPKHGDISEKTYNCKIYTTVDPAISEKEEADDSVVMTCAITEDNDLYILEYTAERLSPRETITELFRLQSVYGRHRVGVEVVAYQKALKFFIMEEMRKNSKYFVIDELRSSTKKEVRIKGLEPRMANGMIFHKKGMPKLELQLLEFPRSKHDDVIDALAMQLDVVKKPNSIIKQLRRKQEKKLKKRHDPITGKIKLNI